MLVARHVRENKEAVLEQLKIRGLNADDLVKKLIHEGAFSDEIVKYNNKRLTIKEKTCLDLFNQWKLKDED